MDRQRRSIQNKLYNKKNSKILYEKKKFINIKEKGLQRRFYLIKSRCEWKNNVCYRNYGGRGIKCLWKTYKDFKKDMHESYIKHIDLYGKRNTTIDRINVNGDYCKENCRWTTIQEQQNNKTTSHMIIFNGEKMTIGQWSKRLGINYNTLHNRIQRKNMSIEDAITRKVRYKKLVLKTNM